MVMQVRNILAYPAFLGISLGGVIFFVRGFSTLSVSLAAFSKSLLLVKLVKLTTWMAPGVLVLTYNSIKSINLVFSSFVFINVTVCETELLTELICL